MTLVPNFTLSAGTTSTCASAWRLPSISPSSPRTLAAPGPPFLLLLTAPEARGLSLSCGMCQQEAGQVADAAQSFGAAARLAPGCGSCRKMAEHLTAEAGGQRLTKLQLKQKQGPL